MHSAIEVVSIVVHYNNAIDCITVVNSLLTLEVDNHLILVVDNRSRSEEWNVISENFEGNDSIFLIKSHKNGGFGYGINYGYAFIRNKFPTVKYLHVINCDAIVSEKFYLRGLIKELAKSDKFAIIGPAVFMEDNSTIQNTILPFTTLKNAVNFKKEFSRNSFVSKPPQLIEVDCINGVCFVIKASVFEEIGGFCEDYFMYNEEQDLCYRIKANGYKVLFWSSKSIIHKGAQVNGIEKIDWRYLFNRRNQVLFISKFGSKKDALILAVLFIISGFRKIFFNKNASIKYLNFVLNLLKASRGIVKNPSRKKMTS